MSICRCGWLVLLFISLTSGCGGNAPPTKAVDSVPVAPVLTPTPAATAPIAVPVAPTVVSKAVVTVYKDADFLSDDVVGLVVVHPRRLTQSPFYQLRNSAEPLQQLDQALAGFKLELAEIERVTFVFDQPSVDATLEMIGLDLSEVGDSNPAETKPAGGAADLPRFPAAIITLTKSADRPAIVRSLIVEAEQEEFEGQTLRKNERSAVWFAADDIVVCGPLESVRNMIAQRQTGRPGKPPVLARLAHDADFAASFNPESQAGLIERAAQASPVAGAEMLQQTRSLAIQMNLTGPPGGKLLELLATVPNESACQALSQSAGNSLAKAKEAANQFAESSTENQAQAAAIGILNRAFQSAAVRQQGAQIEFLIVVPDDFEQLPKLLDTVHARDL